MNSEDEMFFNWVFLKHCENSDQVFLKAIDLRQNGRFNFPNKMYFNQFK